MSIENDLKRLADATEGILAYLTGTEVPVKRPGRPARKNETVEPAPQAPEAPAPAAPAANPVTAEAKPAAAMPVVEAPTQAAPAASNVTTIPTPLAQAAAGVPTVADLQKAVGAKVGAGKRDGVLAIISSYGVDRASGVPEDKRAEALAKINAL